MAENEFMLSPFVVHLAATSKSVFLNRRAATGCRALESTLPGPRPRTHKGWEPLLYIIQNREIGRFMNDELKEFCRK
jgi:hypothetical protein